MALLSEKTNPLDDKDMRWLFRLSRFVTAASVLGVMSGLYLFAFEPKADVFSYIRIYGTIVLNGCLVYVNFRDMVKIKKKARMKKVINIADIRADGYEAMTLKFAVSNPELPPPDREEYEQVKRAVKEEDVIFKMIAAAHGIPPNMIMPRFRSGAV